MIDVEFDSVSPGLLHAARIVDPSGVLPVELVYFYNSPGRENNGVIPVFLLDGNCINRQTPAETCLWPFLSIMALAGILVPEGHDDVRMES